MDLSPLPGGWRSQLQEETDQPYFQELKNFLAAEMSGGKKIFPASPHILRALKAVDYDQVRVVILGQDPYHGPGQAIGFSFAVPNDLQPKPPSLKNIFKEIQSDLGLDMRGKGTELSGWVEQGVLLLNSVLTVRASEAFSHRGQGWERFTDRIIQLLNERTKPVIFVLWGAAAQKKKLLITSPGHFVIESVHPSPLSASRGFFGSKPFSKINDRLRALGEVPIDWARTVSTR